MKNYVIPVMVNADGENSFSAVPKDGVLNLHVAEFSTDGTADKSQILQQLSHLMPDQEPGNYAGMQIPHLDDDGTWYVVAANEKALVPLPQGSRWLDAASIK